jgi:hypothetical protein
MSSKPKTRGLAEILRLEKERRASEDQQKPAILTSAPDATVAPHATVALNATVAPDATVASNESLLVLRATVAGNATVAPDATVAPHAPVISGYTSFTNDLLDRILPTLDPFEQVVLLRLYRLTHGFNQEVAKVGYNKLISACNVKKRKLSDAIRMLEQRGYIERVGLEQGGARREERGTHYRILLHAPTRASGATVARRATVAPDATVAPNDPYKRKALKENLKRDSASLETKNCPDCQGSGFWYPEGIEKGVAKCKHKRLREGRQDENTL